MVTAQLLEDEYCTQCGKGVDYLNPFTGWCRQCSTGYCESCGRKFSADQNSRKICPVCRRHSWLERNADAIERVMSARQITVVEAVQVVYDDNRPRCVMCGDVIKHGTKSRMRFCRQRDRCRRASIRFHHYRIRNKLSDDEALEKALGLKTNDT